MSTVADFYVIGGTLQRDAPSYVKRQADDDLYNTLSAGQFSYVLTSRQMGKSSLMVRTAVRLRANGVSVAVLDLTAIGQNVTPEQWYQGLLGLIGEQLRLEDELEDFWLNHDQIGPLQRWMTALIEVVLARKPNQVVVFVDEIDVVRSLPFSTDEFFAAIREFHNRRTRNSDLERLTFCLLGVATPSDLIRDTRTTPFNIGKRIEIQDFSLQEAEPLTQGLGRDEKIAAQLLNRVLYWTDGHPYLTQRLCQALAEDQSITTLEGVDRICGELFLSVRAKEQDDNLIFVRERVLSSGEADRIALLDLYLQIRKHKRVRYEETNPVVSVLRLSGIVRVVEGNLRVRNRIYTQAFDQKWAQSNMPDAELQRQRRAYRNGQMRAAAIAAIIITVLTGSVTFAALRERNRAVGEKSRADLNAEKANEANQELQQVLIKLQAALDEANKLREIADRKSEQTEDQRGKAEAQRQLAEEQRKIAEERSSELDKQRKEADALRLTAEKATLLIKHLYYGANMNFANQELEQSNISSLIQLLNGQVPTTSAEEDLRRFEWNYFWGLAHGYLWSNEAREPSDLKISPEGRRIASVGEDSLLRVWDAVNGEEIPDLQTKIAPRSSFVFTNQNELYLAELHLVENESVSKPDSLKIESGEVSSKTKEQIVEIYKIVSGATGEQKNPKFKIQLPRLSDNDDPISFLSLLPDGSRLLTVSKSQANIWDVRTGDKLLTITSRIDPNGFLDFSPDGKLLACTTQDHDLTIRSTSTGEENFSLKGANRRGIVKRLIFAADGLMLATVDSENIITVWDGRTGEQLLTIPSPKASVNSLAFSPDVKSLAIGSANRTVRLVSLATGEELSILRGHEGAVTSLTFSPDGLRLFTGSSDNTIKSWDVMSESRRISSMGKEYGKGSLVAFSASGELLATAGGSNPVRVWNSLTQVEVGTIENNARNISALTFSGDGERLAVGDESGIVKIWNLRNPMKPLTLDASKGVMALAFSPNGAWLVTGNRDWSIQLWDSTSGRLLRTWEGHAGAISSAAFSPDGKILATGSTDKTVKLWDPITGEELLTLSGHAGSVTCLAFSPEGKHIASGSNDATIRLWNVADGENPLILKNHERPVSSLAYSMDGSRLFSGSWDDTVKIWDTISGKVLLSLGGYRDGITSVAISSDGKRLAVGTREEWVRVIVSNK